MPTMRIIKTENSGLIIMSLDDGVTLKLIYGEKSVEVPEHLLLETASEFFHERGLRRMRKTPTATAAKPRKTRKVKQIVPPEHPGSAPALSDPLAGTPAAFGDA